MSGPVLIFFAVLAALLWLAERSERKQARWGESTTRTDEDP